MNETPEKTPGTFSIQRFLLPFQKGTWDLLKKRRGVWIFEVGNHLLKGVFCLREGRTLRVGKLLTEAVGEETRESLKAFFTKAVLAIPSLHPAWVFVSRNRVTLRDLEIPSTNAKELTEMVDLQISKQTPYSRDEIISDWRAHPHSRAGFSHVMLAIAHRLHLTDYFAVLQELGFVIERVGLVSSGLPFFVPRREPPETLLLEVSGAYSELQVVSLKGEGEAPNLLFSRSIPVGASRLSENETESWDKLFAEIKRSLEIMREEQVAAAPLPQRILLLGASAPLERLRGYLSQELAMECEVAPSLDRFFLFSQEAREACQTLSVTDSLYGLLGGLSLPEAEHFDLMPSEIKLRKSLEHRTQEIMRLGILVGLFVIALSGIFFDRVSEKTRVLRRLEGRYQETLSASEGVEKMRGMLALVRRRMSPRGSALEFLEILHEVTPDDMYYSDIFFEVGKPVSVRGYAREISAVFHFVTRLETMEAFKEVETKYATKRKIQGEELIEFEIAGKFVGG